MYMWVDVGGRGWKRKAARVSLERLGAWRELHGKQLGESGRGLTLIIHRAAFTLSSSFNERSIPLRIAFLVI